MKELCDCGNVAVWDYLPGYSDGSNSYSCDDCVPRGCSCNWIPVKGEASETPIGIENFDWKYIDPKQAKENGLDNVKSKEYFIYLDSKKRAFPCCEYDYSEDGYDK